MANIITVSRFPLLLLIVILLTTASAAARMACVPLILLLILLDTVDGLVARARKEESLLGSVLDIMVDRSVEIVLWIVFGHLGLVPLAIPLIFVVRGTVVDSLRSIGVQEGKTPFGTTQSAVGRWLVASPWMRSGYGIAKASAFMLLALTSSLLLSASAGSGSLQTAQAWHTAALLVSWIATLFCVVRGLPGLVESIGRLSVPSSRG